MIRVIIASCDAQNLPHLSYLPLPPMYKKWFLASHFFTVWSTMMKLHKNDWSNKSSLLDRHFAIWGYLPLPWGYIHVQNHEKIYVKSEFKAVLLKLTANVQSENSFLWCSKFAPLELSVPAFNVQKNGFWPLVPLQDGVSWWNRKNDWSNKSSILA